MFCCIGIVDGDDIVVGLSVNPISCADGADTDDDTGCDEKEFGGILDDG